MHGDEHTGDGGRGTGVGDGAASRSNRTAGGNRLIRPLADEVLRHRLLERMAARFEVAVVTVVAGAGFGKSTLLDQALRTNEVRPQGIDLAHRCSPFDVDPARLARALAARLGASVTATEPGLAALQLADAMAAAAPREVCLLLDDVHLLGDGTGGADLVGELVRALPRNGHLVLAGRSLPSLALSKLRSADQVVELADLDLRFDHSEVEQLVATPGEAQDLAPLGGWPAMVRLAVTVGPAASSDYLWEEVVAGLGAQERTALAALVLAGGLDDDLLRAAVGGPGRPSPALDTIPLLHRDREGGAMRAHGLWEAHLSLLVDDRERRELAGRVAGVLSERDHHERAVALAAQAGDRLLVEQVMLRGLAAGAYLDDARLAARWRGILDRCDLADSSGPLASEGRSGPGDEMVDRLLAAIEARMSGGESTEIRHDLHDLIAGFEVAGRTHAEVVAASELATMAWLAQDIDELTALYERVEAVGGSDRLKLRTHAGFIAAMRADLTGEPDLALAALEEITGARPRMARQVERWRASLLILAGRADEAVRHAEQLSSRDDYYMHRMNSSFARWQAGDPGPLATSGSRPRGDLGARDNFIAAVYGIMVGASLWAEAPDVDLDRLAALSGPDGRDRTLVAMSRAAVAVVRGDEQAAAAEVAANLAEFPPDHRRAENERRRNLACAAVLSPSWRASLGAAELGPCHQRRLALAQFFVDLREGRSVDWSTWPAPGDVVTGLPLRWSTELACRAAAARRPEGLALGRYLVDLLGDVARQVLAAAAQDADPLVAQGARALTTELPSPPGVATRIDVLGPFSMARDGQVVDDDDLRRRRVRQLLALLVLRGRMRRAEVMALLWPEHDEAAAGRSLRTTLTHVRRLLEPDREVGRPSYLLRQSGDLLELHQGEHLASDLWDFRSHMARAQELDRASRAADALAAYLEALERWRGTPMSDLMDVDGVLLDVRSLEESAMRGARRAAELLLTRHDTVDQVGPLTDLMLAIDPHAEDAFRFRVLESLARGDRMGARRAAQHCRQALDDLGVPPAAETLMVLERAER